MSNSTEPQPSSGRAGQLNYTYGEERTSKGNAARIALIAALVLIGAIVFGPVQYDATTYSTSLERTDTTIESGTTIFALRRTWLASSYPSDGAYATCTVAVRGWWLIPWGSERVTDSPGGAVTCTTWPFGG